MFWFYKKSLKSWPSWWNMPIQLVYIATFLAIHGSTTTEWRFSNSYSQGSEGTVKVIDPKYSKHWPYTGSTESWFFPVYCLFCLKKSAASNHVIFQITESWLKRQNLIVFYIPPSRASLWPIWGNCVQKPFVCKKAERII